MQKVLLVALMLAHWRGLGSAIMPYAIAANAIPIIAFAPITNNWFGAIDPESKMAIAAIICFFPVFVNTLRGLTSVQPTQIELMRSYAAGEVDVFRRVRIPNALPFIFTGLKVATVSQVHVGFGHRISPPAPTIPPAIGTPP